MSSNDITFCADADKCPEKNKCQRVERPNVPDYVPVSYSNFYASRRFPDEIKGCEYFLSKERT